MATFDFLSLQKSIAGIGGQSRQLPAKLEQSERQREERAAPPMPHSKLTEPLCARVDKIGERSPGIWFMRCATSVTMREVTRSRDDPAIATQCHGRRQRSTRHSEALSLLMSDVIKDGMRRACEPTTILTRGPEGTATRRTFATVGEARCPDREIGV